MAAGFELEFGALGMGVAAAAALFLTVFAGALAKRLRRRRRSGSAPRMTVPARVVAKRALPPSPAADRSGPPSAEAYYVTFRAGSGTPMELQVPGPEYRDLAVGDRGQVTFQGSQYLRFDRAGWGDPPP